MANHAAQALFDLAVNRAARVTGLLGMAHLATWHSKTRFAVRVPLAAIRAALESRPNEPVHWSGGEAGSWQTGEAITP